MYGMFVGVCVFPPTNLTHNYKAFAWCRAEQSNRLHTANRLTWTWMDDPPTTIDITAAGGRYAMYDAYILFAQSLSVSDDCWSGPCSASLPSFRLYHIYRGIQKRVKYY